MTFSPVCVEASGHVRPRCCRSANILWTVLEIHDGSTCCSSLSTRQYLSARCTTVLMTTEEENKQIYVKAWAGWEWNVVDQCTTTHTQPSTQIQTHTHTFSFLKRLESLLFFYFGVCILHYSYELLLILLWVWSLVVMMTMMTVIL